MLQRLLACHGKTMVAWFTADEAYGDNARPRTHQGGRHAQSRRVVRAQTAHVSITQRVDTHSPSPRAAATLASCVALPPRWATI
jgi:hypothetical protein